MLESKNNEMNLRELNESPGKENDHMLGSATFNMSVMSKKIEEVAVNTKPGIAVAKVVNK